MHEKTVIHEYQKVIENIYIKYDLTCLRGLDNKYLINGQQIIVWHSEITRKNFLKYGNQFDYYKNFDDLLFCSDELLYFTAHLFLYRPFINNPIKDGFGFSGKMIYPNYQNMEAKRYAMFLDIVSQKAYNYWDRIGDLIASFFPEHIKPYNVFFPTAIEAIPVDFHSNENYLWLKQFKETEYLELNKLRKQIVHYTTSDTEFKHKHLAKTNDREEMQILLKERDGLADFYKRHILVTLTGLEKTLLFFEEISPKLFVDTE